MRDPRTPRRNLIRRLSEGAARRPLRSFALGVVAVLALLSTWAIIELLLIRSSLEQARSGLLDADLVELARDDGGVAGVVDQAADHLERAERRARTSPVLRLTSRVPIVSDQLGGLRAITRELRSVGEVARRAGASIQDRIDALDEGPPARVALLEEVLVQLDHLRDAVDAVDLGAATASGPIGSARDELLEELESALERLGDAGETVETARDLVVGPTRFLILAGNNSEMRGTPMPLSAGLLDMVDGEIEMTQFVQTSTMRLDPALTVPSPGDLAALYQGAWGIGREWRMTTTTPRFPVAGSLFTEMAARTPVGEIDGVVLIDAVTLGRMVDAADGIVVDGEELSGAEVMAEVLNRSYLELAGDASVRRMRLDRQGEFARAAFDQITEATDALLDLVGALPDLAAGRHMLAWSADPAIQALWEDLGADGELPDSPLMVAVQNASGSKRDWYLDPEVVVSAGRSLRSGEHQVLLDVVIDNPEIEPTSDLIEGTSRFLNEPGEHRSFITVYLPESAFDIVPRRGTEIWRIGSDGDATVVAIWSRVPPGETGVASIGFSTPQDQPGAVIVPSGRVRPMTYRFGDIAVPDSTLQTILWVPPPAPDLARERLLTSTVAALAVLANVAALVLLRRRRLWTGPGHPGALTLRR